MGPCVRSRSRRRVFRGVVSSDMESPTFFHPAGIHRGEGRTRGQDQTPAFREAAGSAIGSRPPLIPSFAFLPAQLPFIYSAWPCILSMEEPLARRRLNSRRVLP